MRGWALLEAVIAVAWILLGVGWAVFGWPPDRLAAGIAALLSAFLFASLAVNSAIGRRP